METPRPDAPRTVQCTFCLFENTVTKDQPLCLNCDLALDRILHNDAPTATEPPLVAVPELHENRAAKRRKKKARRKRTETTSKTDGLAWLREAGAVPTPTPPWTHTPSDATPVAIPPVAPSTPTNDVRPMPPGAPYDASVKPLLGVSRDATPGLIRVTPPRDIESDIANDIELDASLVAPLRRDTPEGDMATGDMSFEATIVMPRRATSWVIEFEDGATLALPSDDVIVGRQPVQFDGTTTVQLPDDSRQVSRTHARLRRDIESDTWTIEDLASANGVATVDGDTGALTWVTRHTPTPTTEYLLIGHLRCRLRHDAPAGATTEATPEMTRQDATNETPIEATPDNDTTPVVEATLTEATLAEVTPVNVQADDDPQESDIRSRVLTHLEQTGKWPTGATVGDWLGGKSPKTGQRFIARLKSESDTTPPPKKPAAEAR